MVGPHSQSEHCHPRSLHPGWFIAGAVVYTVFPGDLDFVPILGWIDDFLVCYLAYRNWAKSHAIDVSREGPEIIEATLVERRD